MGESELEIDFSDGTVESFVKEAAKKHAKLGDAIITEDGNIDYSINVVLNGRPLTETAMKEQVKDGDEIVLLGAVAGG